MIGTGYVGLTTGLGFASLGHRVACVDTDASKVSSLDLGEAPFYEPGLAELLKEQQEKGQIMFTTDLSAVISQADVIMIAVGTPPSVTGEADLSYVFAVADEIGRLLDHEAVIITKSTVPVGTNREILERVRHGLSAAGRDDLTSLINIASVPEFLREGTAIGDFLSPDRVVIGADDEAVYRTLDQLHDGIKAPRVFTTLESAELIKYAANAFLATKISFINEISNIAERTGADVREIARGIGFDKRIGHHFLRAGIGYGGSCFPKDVSALHQLAGVKGYDFKLLSSVIEVNNRQRELFFQRIRFAMGNLQGRRIGVWGLAFKPGTDDIRESAGLYLVQRLFAEGAEVVVYDPEAMPNSRKILSDGVEFAPSAIDAAEGVDLLVLATEWPEFKNVSFPTLKSRMLTPHIFDGRNYLADLNLEKLGFIYEGVGLGRSQ